MKLIMTGKWITQLIKDAHGEEEGDALMIAARLFPEMTVEQFVLLTRWARKAHLSGDIETGITFVRGAPNALDESIEIEDGSKIAEVPSE